jgi:glycosyltransferase involved in cell wall biosynthesis
MTDQQKLLKLAWCGWESDDANGYATISKRYREGMRNFPEFKFVNNYHHDWDALIGICTPISWLIGKDLTPRPDLIYHTMFEAEPLPPGWVDNLNCAGLIWTPSGYCADLFRRSGVTTDIVKIGYGIDHHAYTYINRRNRDQNRPFRVLIWGDSMISRKNVIKSAKVFLAAHLPNAELEIKVHSFLGATSLTMFVDDRGQPRSNVSLHHGSWDREKLIAWLHSGDILLYLSGGEGFGQQPPEAMATGLPVICAANTGMLEYLTEENALLVPTEGRVRADGLSLAFDYQATMCNPSFDAAVEHLRWAYHHREALHDIGDRGYESVQSLTWENVCAQAKEMLIERFGH